MARMCLAPVHVFAGAVWVCARRLHRKGPAQLTAGSGSATGSSRIDVETAFARDSAGAER